MEPANNLVFEEIWNCATCKNDGNELELCSQCTTTAKKKAFMSAKIERLSQLSRLSRQDGSYSEKSEASLA
jgi:hypothetical protein